MGVLQQKVPRDGWLLSKDIPANILISPVGIEMVINH
jgi:hypothetical protein